MQRGSCDFVSPKYKKARNIRNIRTLLNNQRLARNITRNIVEHCMAMASLITSSPLDKQNKLDYALYQSITKRTECQSDTLSKQQKSPPKWAFPTQAMLTQYWHDAKLLATAYRLQFLSNHASYHATASSHLRELCSHRQSGLQVLS